MEYTRSAAPESITSKQARLTRWTTKKEQEQEQEQTKYACTVALHSPCLVLSCLVSSAYIVWRAIGRMVGAAPGQSKNCDKMQCDPCHSITGIEPDRAEETGWIGSDERDVITTITTMTITRCGMAATMVSEAYEFSKHLVVPCLPDRHDLS